MHPVASIWNRDFIFILQPGYAAPETLFGKVSTAAMWWEWQLGNVKSKASQAERVVCFFLARGFCPRSLQGNKRTCKNISDPSGISNSSLAPFFSPATLEMVFNAILNSESLSVPQSQQACSAESMLLLKQSLFEVHFHLSAGALMRQYIITGKGTWWWTTTVYLQSGTVLSNALLAMIHYPGFAWPEYEPREQMLYCEHY